ncbi:MAG TPA: hypothetical protein PLN06_01460 [Bacteroidales bacterium]|nr:hypothetical protein [Bacteroidales bacterium]HOU95280.1 hypothetical protein [Bacteroidales bacterium]HQG35616.1 hypothetical protein [Bacteroidales bacterium]HQG51926.1 hypothetical protein [Bacteroidales bacterium]HQJ19621.1 hypothetical protein [Bacteroidales bacterium]
MKKDWFILELIKSFPFKVLVFIVLFILAGVYITKCKEKQRKVQMKEDVLYVLPKPKVQ